ncbi:MAG: hypothetical protein WB383_01570 [Acidimicrobiales bacterium]
MVGTVAIIAVGAGLPIGLLPMSGTASGGDPGGAILRELLATKSAAPPGSHPRTAFAKEPEWIGSCSDETLRKGWSVVLGASSFESRLPVAEVQSYVARRLALAGWKTVAVAERRGEWYVNGVLSYTYLTQWTKELPQKTMASISLQTSIPVRRQQSGSSALWLIGGTANPVPPMGFCGGG